MKFIAHRGYSKQFPENSLEAFKAVIDHPQNGKSLIGIELDIHLTADNRIPVMHDTKVKSPGGKEKPVSSITFEELQCIRGGSVPRIEEVFELVNHTTILCFEIKKSAYDPGYFVTILIKLLESYRPAGDVWISSFSREIMREVITRASRLNLRYGFLYRELKEMENLPRDIRGALHFQHPKASLLFKDPGRIAGFGLPVNTWTVDDPADVCTIIDFEKAHRVRSIMTNDITLSERFGDK